MKNRGFIFLLVFVGLFRSNGQELNLKDPNAKEDTSRLHFGNKTGYIEYAKVDKRRDIMWSKTVWEYIDLAQKKNYFLYYPTDSTKISSYRRSLFDALVSGVRRKVIKQVFLDEYFVEKLKIRDLEQILSRIDTTSKGIEQFNAGEEVSAEYITKTTLGSKDIRGYKIKGMWYFDKKIGELKYRILALCPVAPDVTEKDSYNPDLVELFWVWYADARELLYMQEVFNPVNHSFRYNFDHLLNERKFSSVIYKEENELEDRSISDYIRENAVFQLRESGRIRESIRNFEQDIWNY